MAERKRLKLKNDEVVNIVFEPNLKSVSVAEKLRLSVFQWEGAQILMTFEWDEEKNLVNKQKHKISFETAAYVFDDPGYVEIYDFEHSMDEERYIAIGKVGEVLFVVFTERGERIRIISARLATDAERRLYYDQSIYY